MNPEKDYLGKLVEPFTYKVSNLLEEVKSLRSRLAEVEKEKNEWKAIATTCNNVCCKLEAELLAAKNVVEAARPFNSSSLYGPPSYALTEAFAAYDAALGRKEL